MECEGLLVIVDGLPRSQFSTDLADNRGTGDLPILCQQERLAENLPCLPESGAVTLSSLRPDRHVFDLTVELHYLSCEGGVWRG
jgi:hypothetical protein